MVNPRPQQFDLVQDSLLLVEGIDDLRFARALLAWLDKSNIQLVAVGGISRFRPFLADILTKHPDFDRLRSLGIMRDADENASSTFQSLSDALMVSQLPAPSQPWQVEQEGQLRVSLAILPDGVSPGNLEDLCLRSLAGRQELVCVEQYMTCIESNGQAHRQPSKARLHAFLAAGGDPGLRIGEAADAGVWDWELDAFRQLADYLRGL